MPEWPGTAPEKLRSGSVKEARGLGDAGRAFDPDGGFWRPSRCALLPPTPRLGAGRCLPVPVADAARFIPTSENPEGKFHYRTFPEKKDETTQNDEMTRPRCPRWDARLLLPFPCPRA